MCNTMLNPILLLSVKENRDVRELKYYLNHATIKLRYALGPKQNRRKRFVLCTTANTIM